MLWSRCGAGNGLPQRAVVRVLVGVVYVVRFAQHGVISRQVAEGHTGVDVVSQVVTNFVGHQIKVGDEVLRHRVCGDAAIIVGT